MTVLEEIRSLRDKKGQDYNCNIELKEYFPFGQISYTQMIHLKATRLRSLTKKESEPNYDALRDTLVDLINYAIFNIEAIDRGEV